MTRVRIILTLKVDEEEYPMPSDGNLGAEIEDYFKDIIHEVDGFKITNMRITTEEI
jgi:hypothetical protein